LEAEIRSFKLAAVFLEEDRGTETLEPLVLNCLGYYDFYRFAGMAKRYAPIVLR
jgi:hypothetical protein